jgi:DNA-binding response OmpR family regulator
MNSRRGTAEETEETRLNLLIADDHEPFARALRRWLVTQNPTWEVELCADAETALHTILEGSHDAVLLDWHFGDGLSGLDVCRRARAAGSTVPIVMLTMMDAVPHRIAALDAGANDYLVKDSVSSLELCRRIEVVFQRARSGTPPSGPVAAVGPITVSLATQTVFVDGQLVHLPKRERQILLCLAQTPGEVVTYEELFDGKPGRYGARFKNLQNEMSRLRARLGEAGKWILTVHGVGYRLGAEKSEPGDGDG